MFDFESNQTKENLSYNSIIQVVFTSIILKLDVKAFLYTYLHLNLRILLNYIYRIDNNDFLLRLLIFVRLFCNCPYKIF